MDNYWRISDFAKQVNKHTNTVDGWFKNLEDKKIHFINRTDNGEKVYDQTDLDIALYIKDKRDNKWSLDAIFDDLHNYFDLRAAPSEYETNSTSVPYVIDVEAIKKEILTAAEQIAVTQTEEIKSYYKELISQLPKSKTRQEEREERIELLLLQKKVERVLTQEAKDKWNQKPESERFKRVGFFRKEEDTFKREEFIKDYINEHFESRLKDSLDTNK
jgi:DNA-binding transcriptional MerR regulator